MVASQFSGANVKNRKAGISQTISSDYDMVYGVCVCICSILMHAGPILKANNFLNEIIFPWKIDTKYTICCLHASHLPSRNFFKNS